jgi:hypothetical protein
MAAVIEAVNNCRDKLAGLGLDREEELVAETGAAAVLGHHGDAACGRAQRTVRP